MKLQLNSSTTDERIATCLPADRRNDDAMKTEAGIKKLIIDNGQLIITYECKT
ncbi:MAG TPA: hypothetical protein VHZ50_09920 [Puia sp.]|nr:hypothetical protein [Puia sp.]